MSKRKQITNINSARLVMLRLNVQQCGFVEAQKLLKKNGNFCAKKELNAKQQFPTAILSFVLQACHVILNFWHSLSYI